MAERVNYVSGVWYAVPCPLSEIWKSLGVSHTDPVEVALADSMLTFAAAKWAPGSLNQYTGAFARFATWCEERNPPRESLPAEPLTVALYLLYLTQISNTFSVIKTASAAIHTMHKLSLSDKEPTSHPLVQLMRESSQRVLGARLVNQKEPLDFEVLRKAANRACETDDFLLRLSVTMAVLGFAGFLRYSDLVILTAADVRFEDGHMKLFLEHRKNDQLREGNVVISKGCTGACPVWWTRWLFNSLGLQGNTRLFQRFDGRVARFHPGKAKETLTGIVMPYEQCSRLVLRLVATELGISEEHAKKRFGTQSLRSGGATLVAAEGVDDRNFQRHGGWRSVAVKDRYVKDSLDAKLAVTAVMRY